MTPLALVGTLLEPLRLALRDRGFELEGQGEGEHDVSLAVGSAAVAVARGCNEKGLVVAVCEPADWEASLRAGADFVAPPDPTLLVASVDRASRVAGDRRALDAFQKAAALTVPGSKLADLEQAAILAAMRASHGHTARAAAMLDISVRKVQYKLHEYGMPPTRKRAESEARWGRSTSPNGGKMANEWKRLTG